MPPSERLSAEELARLRRVCEHALDGVDVLALGIQPEHVLALLDERDSLAQDAERYRAALEELPATIRYSTTGVPPERSCLAGTDEKWEGYTLGIDEAVEAIEGALRELGIEAPPAEEARDQVGGLTEIPVYRNEETP